MTRDSKRDPDLENYPMYPGSYPVGRLLRLFGGFRVLGLSIGYLLRQ